MVEKILEQSDLDQINVEVAFALPEKQRIITIRVPKGTTAKEAVVLSNIQNDFKDDQLLSADLGVFGKSIKPDFKLRQGDRVEIYRPLLIDPKEVRKRRADEAKAKRAAAKDKQAK